MGKDPWIRFFHAGEREPDGKEAGEQVREIAIELIVPSPYQPRVAFDEQGLEELSRTIRTHGMIQPLVVREKDGKYELIAGERRLRAAKRIGMITVPAIVRAMSDSQAATAALIENLQRESLSPVEEAWAYRQLMELHGLTQESLAQRLGRGQSTIANKLRLLQLPEAVQAALMDRTISERHARALLALSDGETQVKVLSEIVSNEWSVKQTEARIKQLLEARVRKPRSRRTGISKDVRIALNTIRQSIDMIQKSGVPVEAKEEDGEEFYEFIIRVPKRSAKQGG
ncbi:nucleoid occlusion protein [Kyrpidia spormannii]|uniref:DNA-binding protein Spo0J-like n=2 Tax=Kyrpidia spormannii TaxID=2055160 RepID=A0A6F9EJ94_9BACL|nr:nucleoid occlusion protein [Kyrpidia spormannii]CAB3395877.1 DNA-binding protein Spo0J-like [Kyrpidia spormannii]CAB3396364.1 DNA-binding protein Spo0J-like [Kyrpidia spormannii]